MTTDDRKQCTLQIQQRCIPDEQTVLHKILDIICEDYGIAPFLTQIPITALPQTSASALKPLPVMTPTHVGADVAKFTSVPDLQSSELSIIGHFFVAVSC